MRNYCMNQAFSDNFFGRMKAKSSVVLLFLILYMDVF